jgi:hypothetical protein
MNNTDDNTINNSILKVASLEKAYDIVLKQYKEAYKNYINALNTYYENPCREYNLDSTGISQTCYDKIWADQGCTTTAPDVTSDWQKSQTYDSLVNDSYLWATLTDEEHREGCYGDTTNYNTNMEPTYSFGKDFAELPGRSWWGTFGIKEGNVSSKKECESMCASDINCTGATFNPVKRYCWTRGGDGTVTAGSEDDRALIPKLKVNVIILNKLNDKLISINQQLRTEVKNINPMIAEEKDSYSQKQKQFDDYYYQLSDEKKSIQKLIQQYNTIESELNDKTLVVDQANSSLRLWTILAFLLLLVIMKQSYISGEDSFSNMKYLLIVIVFIILSFSLSKPSGFATLGFIIIALVTYKLNSGSNESV